MDWRRAKTILIVLFAVINVFLISNLLADFLEQRSVSSEAIAQTKLLLEKNGITVDESVGIPEAIYEMKLLGMKSEEDESSESFSRDEEEILFDDFEFTKEALLEKAKDYSRGEGLVSQKGGEWRVVISSDKRALVLWYPEHKRTCLFNGGQTFTFTKDNGVHLVVRSSRLEPGRFIGSNASVWHATAVLADFVSEPQREKAPFSIRDLTIGYYVGANYDREAVPAWEIVTDRAIYYYDATTGRYLGKVS